VRKTAQIIADALQFRSKPGDKLLPRSRNSLRSTWNQIEQFESMMRRKVKVGTSRQHSAMMAN
jgi:hypothetical protein